MKSETAHFHWNIVFRCFTNGIFLCLLIHSPCHMHRQQHAIIIVWLSHPATSDKGKGTTATKATPDEQEVNWHKAMHFKSLRLSRN